MSSSNIVTNDIVPSVIKKKHRTHICGFIYNTSITCKSYKLYWVQRLLQFQWLLAQCNNGSSLLHKWKVYFSAYCGACDLQHSMGFEAACKETVLPLGWLMCTRNTSRTRVFLRPMSVSPLRSSMSELRSFRMPAQSILQQRQNKMSHFRWMYTEKIRTV